MNFYCKRECGADDFSIEEWNRRFKLANDMGIPEGKEREIFLGETKCEKQCEECACIVGERRIKTKQILNQ